MRYTSHHLDCFTSKSSSGHSSLDHLVSGHSTSDASFGHSTSGHSLSGHTPPVTTIADSSTPSRFVYPPLARTPRYSKAYRRWSVEEDIDADVLTDIEADTTTIEVAADMDVEIGVDAGIGMEVNVRVDVEDEVEGEVESSDRGTIEVEVDMVDRIDIPDEDIETGQRELEERSLIASRERAGLLERVASLERSNARLQGTPRMASARVDRFWRRISFMMGKLKQIHRFCYYDRMRFRRLETFVARHL
ncbi:hypothetical protein Tco_1580992, partial [Tanacetum coccineum]